MENIKATVSVRLDLEHKEGLDKLGERVKRDRSFLVNEAVAGYLARQRWVEAHIREGLRQAKAGEFASDEEMAAFYDRVLGGKQV
jgi:predicted transcriptional regulator